MDISPESWIDKRIVLRNSKIEGKGLFALEPIKKGEIAIVWGGTLISEENVKKKNFQLKTLVEIGENLFLGGPKELEEGIDDFINHSCNPNLWMKDEISLQARKNIKKGEEITIDYSMFLCRYHWGMECNCRTKFCRKTVSNNDWELPELQKRYKNHFSPFINARIKALQEKKFKIV